jgi:hypothetical protein
MPRMDNETTSLEIELDILKTGNGPLTKTLKGAERSWLRSQRQESSMAKILLAEYYICLLAHLYYLPTSRQQRRGAFERDGKVPQPLKNLVGKRQHLEQVLLFATLQSSLLVSASSPGIDTLVLCGESNNLGEMGRRIWRPLPPLSAPFAPTLDKGLIQNPCRPGWAQFGPTLVQGARFGLSRLPLPSLSLLISVSSNDLMDQTYIKAATRLRDKMASPLSPSPIFFSGTSDPISIVPPW